MKSIYVDTSVFGGYFDEEFSFWSKQFFATGIKRNVVFAYSKVTEDEIKLAPAPVRELFASIPQKNRVKLPVTEEAIMLAENYLLSKVVGETSRTDCYHIGIASVAKVDMIVSWNFKHIVNIERIQGYNSVNIRLGFKTVEIRNPREAFDYESQD